MKNSAFWWVWAISIAGLTSILSQPLALLGLIGMVIFVVTKFAESESAKMQFRWMLKAAIWLAGIRLLFQIIFGTPMGAQTLFSLPVYELPGWLSGLRLGGDVTLLSLEYGAMQAFRLSTLVVVFAGVAAIANPRQLLDGNSKSFQKLRLYASLTLNFLPQLSKDAERLMKANRWRGQKSNRVLQISRNLVPLTETVLERAVNQGAALSVRMPQSQTLQTTQHLSVPNRLRLLWIALGIIAVSIGLMLNDPKIFAVTLILYFVFTLEIFNLWQSVVAALKNRALLQNLSSLALLLVTFVVVRSFNLFETDNPAFQSGSLIFQLIFGSIFLALGLIGGYRNAKNK